MRKSFNFQGTELHELAFAGKTKRTTWQRGNSASGATSFAYRLLRLYTVNKLNSAWQYGNTLIQKSQICSGLALVQIYPCLSLLQRNILVSNVFQL